MLPFNKIIASAFGALSLALISSPSDAAQADKLKVLGFFQDGKYFAWQSYGVGDGAGIPYGRLEIINVSDDSWAKGSPFKTSFTEEDVNESQELSPRLWLAREEKRALDALNEMAAPTLQELGDVADYTIRFHMPAFQMGTIPKTARFSMVGYRLNYNSNSNTKAHRLELDEMQLPTGSDCSHDEGNQTGMKLSLIDEKAETTTVLTEDKRVPKSRYCPLGYQIEKVVSHNNTDGSTSLAVILRYTTRGFEGADGRLMAITTRIAP
ncbi:MAG: DUF2259 domain-containing protein [Pseudomonadota bacterium]